MSIFNFAGNLLSGHLNRKHAREMQGAQMKYQTEMWNKQNAYNTPLAQRKRMEEAGMNPALMYGSAQTTTGNAQGAPQGSAPTGQQGSPNVDLGGSLGKFADLKIKSAQADLVAQQAETEKAKRVQMGVQNLLYGNTGASVPSNPPVKKSS